MARIKVMSKNILLEEVPITSDRTKIGRDQFNHVHLVGVTVSRFHAEINRRGFCYTIEDKKSSNGTRLNVNYIKHKEVLSDQDLIAIGDFTLVFALDDTDHPRKVKPSDASSVDTVYELKKLV